MLLNNESFIESSFFCILIFVSRMCVKGPPGMCMPFLLLGADLENNGHSMYLIVDHDFFFLNKGKHVLLYKLYPANCMLKYYKKHI